MKRDEAVARISKVISDTLDESFTTAECAEIVLLAGIDAGISGLDLEEALDRI
jgi:hypothetical protein